MKLIERIRSYLPQRVFLIQGNTETYALLEREMKGSICQSFAVPRLSIEHARSIATTAVEGTGNDRTCLVYFAVFSPEAAEVLLKSLEEPDPLTTIVFVTPYPYAVPLTIRSRVGLITEYRSTTAPQAITRTQALDSIKQESDSDDDAATRRAHAVALLDTLEVQCKKDPAKARIVYEAKQMLFGANVPTKFVMEYVVTAVL